MRLDIVNPAEWIPKIAELLQANWAETGFNFSFAPDIQTYQRLYDLGLCFAVRASIDEATIGYCTVTVVAHPHNPEVIVGSNDALFVCPMYRRGTLTARLMCEAEREAKRRGAQVFTWHCRAGTDFAQLLTKHGYKPVDEVVMKEI